MQQRSFHLSALQLLMACAAMVAFNSVLAADYHTANIRGRKVQLPVPAGMKVYPAARAANRADLSVPEANELIAVFMPIGSVEYEEPYYMGIQAYRKDVKPTAEQFAKVTDDMVAAGAAKQDQLERAKAALEKKTPQLRNELGDRTAKIVPLGLVVRGHLMRTENIQAVNATGTFSVTAQGVEQILSRPAHMAFVRVRPDKLVYAYFFGEIGEPPDSKKYESMMKSWLADFDKQNNSGK